MTDTVLYIMLYIRFLYMITLIFTNKKQNFYVNK